MSSALGRFASAVQKNQAVLSILGAAATALAVAVGFSVTTPMRRLNAVESRQSVVETRQTTITTQHRQMVTMLRVLALDVCLRRSAEETQMMQLPCNELLHPSAALANEP